MAPLVVFPDATAVVLALLRSQLTGPHAAPVHAEVPDTRPDRFAVVRVTGGARANLVEDGVQLTLEAWEQDLRKAQTLCSRMRSLIYAARGTVVAGTVIGRTQDVSRPVPMPLDESEQPRYSCTLLVRMRGVAG